MRRARWKRKNVRDELTGKAVNSPKTGTGRHELPTELETPLPAALYLNLNQCAAASAGMEHNGVQIGHPLLLFPLPLPPSNSGRSFQRGGALPSSLVPRPLGGWFPKAGAEAPGLCVVGGPGRSRNALVLFFRGVGRVLFQKRMRPTSLRWKPSLAGAGNYVKARGDAARFPVIRNHDGCPSKFQALRKGK